VYLDTLPEVTNFSLMEGGACSNSSLAAHAAMRQAWLAASAFPPFAFAAISFHLEPGDFLKKGALLCFTT
jgi:hypothetical protein